MKWTLLLTLFSLTAITACRQDIDTRADTKNVIRPIEVTTPAQSAFKHSFPTATEIIWEDAHENADETYKVKFKHQGQYWKAEFTPTGRLVKQKLDD